METVDSDIREPLITTEAGKNSVSGVTSKVPESVHESEGDGIVNEIYRKFNKGLHRFLKRRLDSEDDVEDVAQEVYLRLIRYRKLDEIKPSLTLLCTIAANLLKDRYRRIRVRNIHPHISMSDTEEVASPEASPEEVVKSKEGLKYFQTVYRSLSDDCRQAFMLHRFKGYTYEEIARTLGISKSMVQKHISRVLFQLGKKFENYI